MLEQKQQLFSWIFNLVQCQCRSGNEGLKAIRTGQRGDIISIGLTNRKAHECLVML